MPKKTLVLGGWTKRGLWWKILVSCVMLVGIGAINGLWTLMEYKDWYVSLEKPFFSPPPSSIVGIIWTLMYITMGISTGIIWQIAKFSKIPEESTNAKIGIGIFIIQIVVNMIVPLFFFAFHNLYLLLISVIINLILVYVLIKRYYRVNKTAAFILIPYFLWLVYATILDASLLILNSVKF